MATNTLYLERLTPDNCAMVMVDHQTGTMLGVQDFRLDTFRRNVVTLASAAKLDPLPTVLTGSYVEGPNGPIESELVEMFPGVEKIHHLGPISAGMIRSFSKLLRAPTGKVNLAGVTIDVCLMFPVQQALAAGYEVYPVYDASGCWDQLSELTSIMRLVQMGAVVCSSRRSLLAYRKTGRNPTAAGTIAIFKECNTKETT